MKLISLNTWAGRSLYPLMRFLENKAKDTDVFCFQEVFNADHESVNKNNPGEYVCGDLFEKMSEILSDFQGLSMHFHNKPLAQSLAIFVRRPIQIKEAGDLVVANEVPAPKELGGGVYDARKMQYVKIETKKGIYTVANLHGLWGGGIKTDIPERLAQSRVVKEFFNKTSGPKILCGDFNLLPDTESMKIMEQGMKNLIKEYGIKSTRTTLYRHFNDPEKPNFADYILVSPDIKVKKFEILPDIVSDHSPMFLEFS